MSFFSFDPKSIPTADLQHYLQTAVSPRPIALASTIDGQGHVNLSPFSFFNVFSANPPILIFSPARRVRDNTTKHTLQNVLDVQEVVINIVNYSMIEQMSLSSIEYAKDINEFVKAGFTPIASDLVRPFRVAEAPVQFECKVQQVLPLGENAGAGNLIICEVLKIHVQTSILDANNRIDQHKIDTVARLGGNYYIRCNSEHLFELEKPVSHLGVGVDALPQWFTSNPLFTKNHWGQLGNIESKDLLTEEQLEELREQRWLERLLGQNPDLSDPNSLVFQYLLNLLDSKTPKNTLMAWRILQLIK